MDTAKVITSGVKPDIVSVAISYVSKTEMEIERKDNRLLEYYNLFQRVSKCNNIKSVKVLLEEFNVL